MSAPLRIDLGAPNVQRFLRPDASPLTSTARAAVVQIAGDAPDPLGQRRPTALASQTNLDSGKQEVIVLYGDLILTVDVFAIPGEPIHIHLQCPNCHKVLRVTQDRKAIDFEPATANPVLTRVLGMGKMPLEVLNVSAVGKLSVEPFECTWEVGGARHVRATVHTGATLCRKRIAIDNNVAKDA